MDGNIDVIITDGFTGNVALKTAEGTANFITRNLKKSLNKLSMLLSYNKLKKFHPLYDALDTFLYSPNTQTQEAPYVRDAIDLKRTMIIVVLALLPSFLFGVYNVGLQSPDLSNKSVIDCFVFYLAFLNCSSFQCIQNHFVALIGHHLRRQ